LISQLRPAAISIPANIAEGQGRNLVEEFIQFPARALGSLAELKIQLVVSKEVNYLPAADLGHS
jgi:four helix bundle protein